ncbi:hypothetical protein PAMA_010757 [Pampus argenteus]
MEKMVLEEKLRRGLEEQSAKPQPLPTSTAQSHREKEWEAMRRVKGGEAGNEAQGSSAKSSGGQEGHGGTEARTSSRQEGREWARQHSSRIPVLFFFFFHQCRAESELGLKETVVNIFLS